MSNQKKRVVEDDLYQVIHNEGTHLVESKRAKGEMHSTAYADSGRRSDNDTVTLRKATPEQISAHASKVKSSRASWGQYAKDSFAANANQFGMRMTDYALNRAFDFAFDKAIEYVPVVWHGLVDFFGEAYAKLTGVDDADGNRPRSDVGVKAKPMRESTVDIEVPAPKLRLVDDRCA